MSTEEASKEKATVIQSVKSLCGEVNEVEVHDILPQGGFRHYYPEGYDEYSEIEKKNYKIMMEKLGI